MMTNVPMMIPATGHSVPVAEDVLGLAYGTGYKKIKQGKLRAFRDSKGLLKVSEAELYRYMREEM